VQKLAQICIERPVFATMLIMALTVLGAAGYFGLGVDFFPKIEFPIVNVTTTLRGASPEEVETQVTKQLEEAINQISGVDELRSFSNEGISIVTITFVLEKDPDVAAQEVRDKINSILSQLPDDADPPIIEKLATDASPVLTVAVLADRDPREITKTVDDVLKKNLESIGGVGQVKFVGDRQRQIRILLDGQKVFAYNLNVEQIRQAIAAQNIEIPGGRIDRGPVELSLRTMGRVATPQQFGDIILASRNGTAIRVRDVATIEDGIEEPRTLAKVNGRAAVLLEIRKQAGTNTLQVIDSIKTKIDNPQSGLRRQLPGDFKIEYFRDQSEFIKGSFEAVRAHLLEGGLLAAVIVFLFLSNWRSTLISAVAIPSSIIATFALMKWMDFTLNQITMLALVLMVGIVIDDAIVVLENIFRNMEEKGMDPFTAAIQGTREIGLAVLATTLSLIVVFLPVAFMPGIVGRFMSSLGFTAAFAIGVSLIVSFTLTPMLSSRFLKPSKHGHSSKSKGFYAWLENVYVSMLRWSMAHRWVIVLIAVAVIATTKPLGGLMGVTFLPRDDQALFEINARMAPGSSLSATEEQISRIESEMRKLPHVTDILVTIGADQRKQVDRGQLFVELTPATERSINQFEIMEMARERLTKLQGMTLAVSEASLIQGAGPQRDLQYFIQGPDLAQLNRYAQDIKGRLTQLGGVTDIDLSYEGGKPEVRVIINRDKASDLGVNVASVASAMRTLVAGDDQVTTYREGDDRYNVLLQVSPQFRNSAAALDQLYVPSTTLGNVPVANVASFQQGEGPVQIERTNRQRQILITANFQKGQTLNRVLEEMQSTIEGLKMPAGYAHGPIGQSKEFGRAIGSFLVAFGLALIFMYMILASQFESFIDPITILLSLPLSIPFAFLSLVITKEPFSIIYTSIGILVLFGIVKKNSILQIDHIKQLRREGEDRMTAIVHGCRDRLRPILMTTAALIAGMIPLALGGGPGSASRRTVAIVVIGGQTLCLLLTLLVTPVSYSLFEDLAKLPWVAKVLALFNANQKKAQMPAEVAVGD
jgi:hydrophobic/amphiphilic exporter-1 (mainly G- bacteria), HAE1 family